MAKESVQIRCADNFAKMIGSIQHQVREQTGREVSQADVTAVIAANPPVIKVEAKEKKRQNWMEGLSL
jgi:hypothetical protein